MQSRKMIKALTGSFLEVRLSLPQAVAVLSDLPRKQSKFMNVATEGLFHSGGWWSIQVGGLWNKQKQPVLQKRDKKGGSERSRRCFLSLHLSIYRIFIPVLCSFCPPCCLVTAIHVQDLPQRETIRNGGICRKAIIGNCSGIKPLV